MDKHLKTYNSAAASVKVTQTRLYIDGKFQDGVNSKTLDTISPVTEKVIAKVALAEKEDVDKAVEAANHALTCGPWSKLDSRARGLLLYRLADLVERDAKLLAQLEVLDTGKPIADAEAYDIPGCAATIRYFAGWADKIEGSTIPTSNDFFTYTQKEPVGVCGLIIPWNYPLAMACWKIGPCLASGSTAILKPAEQSPLTALKLAELIEEAGFPAGAINILPGYGKDGAGQALVEHPGVNKIAFTGESKTAEIIKKLTASSDKRLSFELGGKSPNIILKDANFEEAVEGAIGAIFSNQGQNCCAGSRTYIDKSIYSDFIGCFAEKASSRVIGDPFDYKTEHGTLIDKAQFDKTLQYIKLGNSEGAKCLTGGKQKFEIGYFVEPTVFADVSDDMRIAREEIFGPVASLIPFDSEVEVIQQANNNPFGLAAAVWTKNIEKANHFSRALKAGTVWVNCYNVVDPAAPFGGMKHSGSGRELGRMAIDLYLENKTVVIKR